MRNILDTSCRENQNKFRVQYPFFPESCHLRDNVEEYGKSGQATDDNIIRRMRFACRMIKNTNTHSEHVMLLLIYDSTGYVKAAQYYVILHCLRSPIYVKPRTVVQNIHEE